MVSNLSSLTNCTTWKFKLYVCMLSRFSCVWLFMTPWTVAHQAPLSVGFPRQEYWRNLPFPSISSVQFSLSVVSDSLRPYESQHARPPCPSPTPGVHPNPRPLSRWGHPAISSSVVPFSSCPQSLPASESFPMSLRMRWPKYWIFSFSIRTPGTDLL